MAIKTEDPSTSTATPIVKDSSSDAETKASPTEPCDLQRDFGGQVWHQKV